MIVPTPETIADLLNTTAQLEVPRYQREYKWTTAEATEFIDDLDGYVDAEDGRLFLGTIIFDIADEKKKNKIRVVERAAPAQRSSKALWLAKLHNAGNYAQWIKPHCPACARIIFIMQNCRPLVILPPPALRVRLRRLALRCSFPPHLPRTHPPQVAP